MGRRELLDAVAERYDRVRPGYPDDAVDDLLRLADVPRRGEVLEVGPGTGQLTVSLAERGLRVTAVEVGENLAERLRRNLAEYDDAEVVDGDFEVVDLPVRAYDLVCGAMSFHLLDPARRFHRAADLLRPAGALGLVFNVQVQRGDGFVEAAAEAYARHAPHLRVPGSETMEERRAAWTQAVEESGSFGPVLTAAHPWSVTYTRDTYLELLATYSSHLALGPDRLAALSADLAAIIDGRLGGQVVQDYQALVLVAPLRDGRVG